MRKKDRYRYIVKRRNLIKKNIIDICGLFSIFFIKESEGK